MLLLIRCEQQLSLVKRFQVRQLLSNHELVNNSTRPVNDRNCPTPAIGNEQRITSMNQRNRTTKLNSLQHTKIAIGHNDWRTKTNN